MKNKVVIHPYLYTIFSILFLFTHNIAQSSFLDLVLPLIFGVVVTGLLFYALNLIIKDAYKSALLVLLMLVLFFTYGHIYSETRHMLLNGIKIVRHRYLIPVYGITFILLSYLILKAKRNLDVITTFFNTTSTILVAISLFNIVLYQFQSNQIVTSTAVIEKTETEKRLNTESHELEDLPDIYYIIPDGYAGKISLERYYGFDNSEFTSFLSESGFVSEENSFANYVHTQLSLSSSLNMKYINYLTEELGEYSTDPSVPRDMVRNSEVQRFLKDKGYKFVLIRSGWGPTDRNPNADILIKCSVYNEFVKMLVHTTILIVIEPHLFFVDWYRDSFRRMFDELENLPKIPGPKLVLCHFLIPHTPYIFGPNGESRNPQELLPGQSIWMPREGYIGQLQYVNLRLKEGLSAILEQSDRPPVIILQGDHGPASFDEWSNPSDDFVVERTSILNSYYLPGIDSIPKGITPVNSFRYVFDTYFNAGYGMLENRSYFSALEVPHKFTDVTDITQNAISDSSSQAVNYD